MIEKIRGKTEKGHILLVEIHEEKVQSLFQINSTRSDLVMQRWRLVDYVITVFHIIYDG